MVIAAQNENHEQNQADRFRAYMSDGRLHLASFEHSSGGIVLRENIISDAPYLLKWFNDKDNVKWMDSSDKVYTEKDLIESIRYPGLWTLDMTVLKDSSPIGYCSIYGIDPAKREGELSLLIGERGMQRKGYGKDIVKGMCDIGFGMLELKRLHASVYSENHSSLNAFRKNKFSEARRENEIYLELVKSL